LINKKQSLAQIGQEAILTFKDDSAAAPAQPVRDEVVIPEKKRPITLESNELTHSRALKKTGLSIILIAALLTAAIIFDHKTPYLTQFGDWLYKALRLQA